MQEDNSYSVLCEIREILEQLKTAQKTRPNIDKIEQISSSNPFILDYKNRYRVYVWSTNALTLTAEDLGNIAVSANAWNDISLSPGTRIFASGQSSLVPVLVRCTDLEMPSPGGSASVLGAVTANAGTNLNTSALALESGGNLASILAALDDGQETMANSLSVVVASDQSAIAVGVTAGTAFDANQGTIGANTLRTVSGGASTGTKSNVASSASSVTILASNTARKGAIVYNDSTSILYLDLSGGTASSTSYSVQMSSNAYFELPGPNIYNGAITGIWASANGNARVTEFS